jgi:hypothetical protein
MFITVDILKQNKACSPGIKWFERHFPNGAELIDVINHPKVDRQTLHWGYANLITTDEEKVAYRKKLAIETSAEWTIYESDHVINCLYVTRSSGIKNSDYIFGSEGVTNSKNVMSSNMVENSSQIFSSNFVYDSKQVTCSKNITNSINIVNSDYIINSISVMNAASVMDSQIVHGLAPGKTRQIKNSIFISECENIDHCLFCTGIKDAEYMLFNEKIDAMQYEIIKRQLTGILNDWQPEFVKGGEWPEDTIPLDSPHIQRNIIKQFESLPETFWKWIKTLPGYNPAIVYALTFQGNLIKE